MSKTVIVTGMWGSGKTLLTRMVHTIGVKMDLATGDDPDGFEDNDMHYNLTYYPQTLPVELIRQRDAEHPSWGFKRACIWNDLAPVAIQAFRAAHVIMMHRDPVCLSEHTGTPMRDLVEENARALYWAGRLGCPVLHLSSETLFRDPQATARKVREFLGMALMVLPAPAYGREFVLA